MTVDGETQYILELSNDADSINCDYNGNIVDTTLPSCKATLYHGTNDINPGNIDFTLEFDDPYAKGISINGGELVFSTGYTFREKVLRITINAKYANVTLAKTFTLSKNIPGSPGEDAVKTFLKVSTSVITIDKDGVMTPKVINAVCYSQTGSNEPVINTNEKIYYDYDDDTPNTEYNRDNITINASKNFIAFGLKNSLGEYYEVEKVPIIRDGKDGSDGTSINVKGTYNTEAELKKAFPTGPNDPSDCYIVGKDLYVWEGTIWSNVGQFKGDDGKSKFLHVAFANSDDGVKDFSTTDDKGRKYIGQYVDDIEDDSIEPSDYKWKKYVGTGINSVTIKYGVSTSSNERPTSWSDEIPDVPKGKYLWTWTLTDYTDPDVSDTETFIYSYQGDDGDPGEAGNGINSITVEYQVSSSYTTAPTTWVSTPPETSTTNKYLWQKQVIDFTDQTDKTITQVIAVHGATGARGATGVGIQSITQYYFAAHSIGLYPPTASTDWVSDIAISGYSPDYPYLYSFTRTTFTNGTSTNTTPGILGVWGQDGTPGPAGRQGKTVYPAGAYDENITYHSTDNTTPYVIYDEEYYQLNTETWLGNSQNYKNPKDDIANGNKNWIKFDKFEALFAKVGIIDNGTFGAAVFSGDYMFSQYGTTTLNGNELTDEYKNFNPKNPFIDGNSFYPNVCFNFKTGQVWICRKTFNNNFICSMSFTC